MPGQTQPGTRNQEPSIASAGSDDRAHTGPRQIMNLPESLLDRLRSLRLRTPLPADELGLGGRAASIPSCTGTALSTLRTLSSSSGFRISRSAEELSAWGSRSAAVRTYQIKQYSNENQNTRWASGGECQLLTNKVISTVEYNMS